MSDHVTRHPPTVSLPTPEPLWWEGYLAALTSSPLSRTAVDIVTADCRYITEKCVLDVDDGRWPTGRVRRGLVMGAVQSGKTASMLGVAAQSLDAGVDMVVVLAGTRVALWRQTFERLLGQLDGYTSDSAQERARNRILLPDPTLAYADGEGVNASQLYGISSARARRMLDRNRPIVAVVMKHGQHLRAIASTIHGTLLPLIARNGTPFHVLVLDDEADDGSILDARVERNLDPAVHHLKQIPRAIVDLWAARPHIDRTASDALFATYIGYTATPQANFLQSDHNPLAPSDFVVALRTPFDQGALSPRSTTYREPTGPRAYYTGGETYYGRLSSSVVRQPGGADLIDAIRAFLIGGAIRVWRNETRLTPSQARRETFASKADAAARSPEPSSMLLHPSAAVADHFAAAAEVLQVLGLDPGASTERINSGERSLPGEAIASQLSSEESAWSGWLRKFEQSAVDVQAAFDLPRSPGVPTAADWPTVRAILLEEVVPSTFLKIVNSDPTADDRPQFEPVEHGGTWSSPPDLSTIFVSGNVMSRGLTLEGLTTTVFLRSSDDPFADTQMQMQRWFGYRGGYLELCRVFVSEPQFKLFRAYHDADEALRRSVVAAMVETPDAPSPHVLQGRDFTATGKLTNVDNVPLCPGATPFVRLVNSGTSIDPNVELMVRLFGDAPSTEVVVRQRSRGRILEQTLSLVQAAALLDELRYDENRPTIDGWEGARWKDLESKVGIDEPSDTERLLPFFRPPLGVPIAASPYARGGPYAISAYLRLWRACLTHRARGLVATEDPALPWSMVDLAQKARRQPRFYVGIRYGSGEEIGDGPLADLPFRVRPMRRAVSGGELEASWGSRNPRGGPDNYLGDELFDYHHHHGEPPIASQGDPLWRPEGAPGLILFHVIEQEERPFPTVAVGVALPIGGPDQFAARKPSQQSPRL